MDKAKEKAERIYKYNRKEKNKQAVKETNTRKEIKRLVKVLDVIKP